jgi:hypothetical protein
MLSLLMALNFLAQAGLIRKSNEKPRQGIRNPTTANFPGPHYLLKIKKYKPSTKILIYNIKKIMIGMQIKI